MSRSPKAISPELTGGAGFNYEAFVVAYYLSSLLRCERAQGQEGIVTSVAVQQKKQGHPMDDIVVEFDDASKRRVLGLQAKKSLAVGNNKTFREIIDAALETQALTTFTKDVDKCGFVTEHISVKNLRNLNHLIEWSKANPDSGKFKVAIDTAGGEQKNLRDKLHSIIKPADIDAEADFYRHFVALNITEDFMKSELVNRLQELVISNEDGQDLLLFARLYQIARKGATTAKTWTRGTLLKELRGVVNLKAIPCFEADIKLFNQYSASALKAVSDEVGGFHVKRDKWQNEIAEQLDKHRVVSISGLPGCGKSAVLKRFAEKAAVNKPIIFLRGDRIDEKHWNGFAIKLGLENVDAVPFLQEIGFVGTPILFIDGIDRIRPDQRNVIIDLINFIHNDSSLSDWKVLVTSRDQGLEAFRTWFPGNIYAKTGIGNVTVESFSDDEAKILVEEKPQLRSLLFGDKAVKEIARRPFFTSILAHSIPKGIKPKTEIDLIAAWWEQAGHDVISDPIPRRRAIIDLAEKGVRNLGRSIPARDLEEMTISQITTLKADQIIREEQGGAFYSFAHDIFFEWAFFQLLIEFQDDWIDVLRKAGEPPLLGRVVRLKAQAAMAEKGRWSDGYQALAENKDLRKQWQREWLTAPPFTHEFQNIIEEFNALVDADDFALFEKMLVWFQALYTVPNRKLATLQGNEDLIKNIDNQSLAYQHAWPSDLNAWMQLIDWIIGRFIPVRLIPQTLSIFNIWQNVFLLLPNPRSKAILECVNKWLMLSEVGELHDSDESGARRSGYRVDSEFNKSLRSCLLISAKSYPDFAKDLFKRYIADKECLGGIYEELIVFSVIMAEVDPALLADLAEAHLLEELPLEELERQKEHPNGGYMHPRHHLRVTSISEYHYNIYNHLLDREPFKSLFKNSPNIALKLVRNLTNHATESWKQIQHINKQEMGTPIPIQIEFPWGTQKFWGDAQVYSWGYGHFISGALDVAFQSLKDWAFEEIDGGRTASDVIEEIVKDNNCYAILGIAVQLILETQETTETTLAIVTCQRLWGHDVSRSAQEFRENVDGRKGHRQHIISLATFFALSDDEGIREAFKSALARFPDNLPFEREEQTSNIQFVADLKERAEHWSGLGDAKNYKQKPYGERQIMIFYDAPKALTDKGQKRLEESNAFFEKIGVVNSADNLLKVGELTDDFCLDSKVSYAKSIDDKSLYTGHSQYDYSSPESAMTSIAACVIRFGGSKSDDYEWAWGIMARVEAMNFSDDSLNHHSLASFHPVKYLIIALQHDRGLAKPRADSAERLLKLTIHPNDNLKELAFDALFADKDDHLRWVACQLAVNLCIRHRGRPIDGGWDRSEDQQAIQASLASALNAFKGQKKTTIKSLWKMCVRALNAPKEQKDTTMPKLPPAWINANAKKKRWWCPWQRPSDAIVGKDWVVPKTFFHSELAAKIFAKMPIETWMESRVYRPLLEAFLLDIVKWTADAIVLPSEKYDIYHRGTFGSFEWFMCLGNLLARIVPFASLDFMRSKLLKPFFVDEKDALSVLSSFAEMLVCRHVYDAHEIPQNAIPLLDDCVEGVINFQSGWMHDFRMERLISALLFVRIKENAPDAVRYANGDWSEINTIMPVVDKMVKHIGWSPRVMSNFLELCERAGKSYPVSTFAQQINVALSATNNTYAKWNELLLLPRIAAIVQRQADWNYPLRYEDAHALLKILDALIDLGDRRSAALEQTEAFRSIQERPSLG